MDENKKNEMINFDKAEDLMLSFATSKGNLPKWHIGDYWYKVDAFGYENLAECVISDLLEYSNVDSFVHYDLINGIFNNKITNFSKSKSFINENEILITFYRLYFLNTGNEIEKDIIKHNNITERIKYVVDFIQSMVNGIDISRQLTTIMELDMFFLNEDRHFNNLALIRNEEKSFSFAPIFDNGLSLLSDLNEYDLNKDIYKCIDEIKGKPFSTSLEEQCMVSESLYGQQLHFSFNNNDIKSILEKYKEYYDDIIIKRVENILCAQRRKYSYLFS